jgi:hypothetical protein
MGVWRPNEAQRLHHLEDENSRLKRLVADLSLDRELLKALLNQRKACELANIARSSFRYRANTPTRTTR